MFALDNSSYHPDYNCRFWNFTKSVLLKIEVADYTAGKEFHPAPEESNYSFNKT